LTVQERHVFDVSVLNVIQGTWVLSNASHADTVGVVAPQVLDENVGCVWLGGETIISNVDTGVQDGEAIKVIRVKSISVLWLRLFKQY
jgi:hypothetical protein